MFMTDSMEILWHKKETNDLLIGFLKVILKLDSFISTHSEREN